MQRLYLVRSVTPTPQHEEPDEAERRRRTRAAKRSRIIVRRLPAKLIRSRRQQAETIPFAMTPTPWVWSGLMGAQQLQVHLAAPFR